MYRVYLKNLLYNTLITGVGAASHLSWVLLRVGNYGKDRL